ncbi:hypothetical protein HY224_00670, partial [Candidatus Uhrbacteria bacterium]|nr:hypothetical protein [Candidatus Uhrbacteria bacterium]
MGKKKGRRRDKAVSARPRRHPVESSGPAAPKKRARSDPANRTPRPTARLLPILRLLNEYVEHFHIYAAEQCFSVEDLKKAVETYYRNALIAIRTLGSIAHVQIEVDVLALDGGKFKCEFTTSINSQAFLTPMAIALEEGEISEPGPEDGVAPYCAWANSSDIPGVAVATDLRRSGDIVYYQRATRGYIAKDVRNAFKYPDSLPPGKYPYRSLICAPIMLTQSADRDKPWESEDICWGVLDILAVSANAFGEEDCAFAEVCASLLGSLQQSYQSASDALAYAETAGDDPPPEESDEIAALGAV